MPRKLPWLAEAEQIKASKKKFASSSPAPKKAAREPSPDDLVDSDLNPLRPETPKRRAKQEPAARTPSTSPPPAPPDVEYMQSGYDADDIYIMVEDEFFSTAKMFTQHLHHAEYVRFKRLAASRGAETLEAIARPVDGRTKQSGGLRMNMEAEEKRKGIKAGLRDSDASSDERDEYMRDSNLAGLMTTEGESARDLSGLGKKKSNTRAAAGLVQSPRNLERVKNVMTERGEAKSASSHGKESKLSKREEESEEDEDEDDLDAVPTKMKRKSYMPAKKGLFEGARIERASPIDMGKTFKDREVDQHPAQPASSTVRERPRRPRSNGDSTYDADTRDTNRAATVVKTEPASDSTGKPAVSDFLAKRRAERERKEREEKRKARTAIDVPTFLF